MLLTDYKHYLLNTKAKDRKDLRAEPEQCSQQTFFCSGTLKCCTNSFTSNF